MNQGDSAIDVNRLRGLIGRRVEFNGVTCEIIEVLEDGPCLILQDCEDHTVIQADQHGEAHRRVPTTRTVPVLAANGRDFSPAFRLLTAVHDLV